VEKATDTLTLTLRNIITDGAVLREFSSNDYSRLDATGGTQFNKSRMHNAVTASAKQPRVLFCEFFHIPSGSVPWHKEENADVQ
jgi:hypothetical protein